MTMRDPPAAGRVRAERRGRSAETLAAAFLRAKGYRILARRFRVPVGEVDLVAKRGRTLAFVEVKARRTGDAGLEAISPQGRARIARAAEAYLARYPAAAALTLRFDVIVVAPWRLPRHLVGAFGAGGAL
ncbi:MAG: YraN family protein [Bauldia sp.]|nr:YraN family protein [Bauldia sp.]